VCVGVCVSERVLECMSVRVYVQRANVYVCRCVGACTCVMQRTCTCVCVCVCSIKELRAHPEQRMMPVPHMHDCGSLGDSEQQILTEMGSEAASEHFWGYVREGTALEFVSYGVHLRWFPVEFKRHAQCVEGYGGTERVHVSFEGWAKERQAVNLTLFSTCSSHSYPLSSPNAPLIATLPPLTLFPACPSHRTPPFVQIHASRAGGGGDELSDAFLRAEFE